LADFFEIDFLDVESSKSGDAITLRYTKDDLLFIHVVDAGFQDSGESVSAHIKKYYDDPVFIDHVVCTHPDGDHAGGLRSIIEQFAVGSLWMLRPWLYAENLIHRFSRYTSIPGLISRLKEDYPNIAALEEIALEKDIPINDPFQGANIGEFRVLSPGFEQYLDLVVASDKTPDAVSQDAGPGQGFGIGKAVHFFESVKSLIRSDWGVEVFSDQPPSSENEMSVVQYADLRGKRILLTGDAGPQALQVAADYLESNGVALPGIDRFHVPHHGSRRNVNTDILDRLLGKRLSRPPEKGKKLFTALISSAKKDKDHPKKAVVRAMIHRGGKVVTTEGKSIRTGHNAPQRQGWGPVTPLSYPQDQEN
jgi:hypothetical protein